MLLKSLSNNALCVNKPNMNTVLIQGYCSLFQFLLGHGKTFPWILLRAFQSPRVLMSFWLVDRYTKYAHFLPLKHPFSALQVVDSYLSRVASLYGMPKSIVSDRDKIFTSHFWQNMFKRFAIPLNLTTAYHPQSDGQTERVNQCLEMYLCCAIASTPTKWSTWLPLAQYWYNTSFHSALKCSPHRALYGSDPTYGILSALPESTDEAVTDADVLLRECDLFSSMLQHHLARAENHMKQLADSKRTARQYQVGDLVLLKLQPYAQRSVVSRLFPKLAFKYFGPFEILAAIGSVAYKLKLPEDCLIHPVFHVSQLKPFIPDNKPVFSLLPTAAQLDIAELLPSEILDWAHGEKGNAAVVQILVGWGSLPAALATWEDFDVVRTRFPDAVAWGQAPIPGGATVTPVPDEPQ